MEKLGYRGLFGAGLSPGFAGSLSASLGAALISDRSPRDTVIPPAGLGLLSDRALSAATAGAVAGGIGLGVGIGGGTGGGVGGGQHIPNLLGSGAGGGGGGASGGGGGGKDCTGEVVKFSVVYDIASLILYKCQALRIRLKIALDRLFSFLSHEDVLQVLHGFGWTYEDYTRGYMLQVSPLLYFLYIY